MKNDCEEDAFIKNILRSIAPAFKPNQDRIGFRFAQFAILFIFADMKRKYADPEQQSTRAGFNFLDYLDWEKDEGNSEELEKLLQDVKMLYTHPDHQMFRARLKFLDYLDWERHEVNSEELEKVLQQELVDRLIKSGMDERSASILKAFTFVELRIRGINLEKTPAFMNLLIEIAESLHSSDFDETNEKK